ncbi:hypothetical protein [Saccharothrix deserti]|nr:hypothetical protein [Saccharothrix deserti]
MRRSSRSQPSTGSTSERVYGVDVGAVTELRSADVELVRTVVESIGGRN